MKISKLTTIDPDEIKQKVEPDYFQVEIKPDGQIKGIFWESCKFGSVLYLKAIRMGANWNHENKLWVFPNEARTIEMYNSIRKNHPEWYLIKNGKDDRKNKRNLSSTLYSKIELTADRAAIILPFPLPYFSDNVDMTKHSEQCVKLGFKISKMESILVVGLKNNIAIIENNLISQGARNDNNRLAKAFEISHHTKIKISISELFVEINCDLSNPRHYLLKPKQEFIWNAKYPNGIKILIPWDGNIKISRDMWPDYQNLIKTTGIEWECADATTNQQ